MHVAVRSSHLTSRRLGLSQCALTKAPSSCTEDLEMRAILADGSVTRRFSPTFGAPSQSLVTSSAILHWPQALIGQREHPVAGVPFPDSLRGSHNRTLSLLTHSPRRIYSTPHPTNSGHRCTMRNITWITGCVVVETRAVSVVACPCQPSGSSQAQFSWIKHSQRHDPGIFLRIIKMSLWPYGKLTERPLPGATYSPFLPTA